MNRSAAVILNPFANAGRGLARWRRFLGSGTAEATRLGSAPIYDRVAGLEDWLAERLRSGPLDLVAVGGDGTVNLALNTLLALRPHVGRELIAGARFGAVGVGSSNDFHKPGDSPGRERTGGVATRLNFDGARGHDVGWARLRGADGTSVDRAFLINASVGLTAEGNWNFNQAGSLLRFLKRATVDGAILATAFRTLAAYRNIELRVGLDGGPARSLHLTNLGVVKNPHFSGSMRYDVDQASDDGRLGVHVCEGMGLGDKLRVFSALNRGRFTGLPKTSSVRAARVDVEGAADFAVETDGEVTRARAVGFTVEEGGLLVCP